MLLGSEKMHLLLSFRVNESRNGIDMTICLHFPRYSFVAISLSFLNASGGDVAAGKKLKKPRASAVAVVETYSDSHPRIERHRTRHRGSPSRIAIN
jgi:hypothetical protein